MINSEDVKAGVSDAMSDWIATVYEVTLPETVAWGVETVVKAWLDEHGDELMNLVAEKIAKQVKEEHEQS